jgi:hypothetical protein
MIRESFATNAANVFIGITPTTNGVVFQNRSSTGGGNAGFTVQSRTNLALGNWLNVTSPAPQIVGSNWQVALPLSWDASRTFTDWQSNII